uniref:Uncharacterized protein n=1 Tax=Arundo donax TaxID=35708 RepID=A0A0A9GZ16_ARUDO
MQRGRGSSPAGKTYLSRLLVNNYFK